jgi:DNA-binding NtrC family response regulator
VDSISDEAMALLCRYDWPGNVRELENLIERLSVLRSEGEIGIEDLPAALRGRPEPAAGAPAIPDEGLDFRDVVDRFESDLIRQALQQTQGNKNRAAQLLGLNRTTLLEKIKKKGLEPAS